MVKKIKTWLAKAIDELIVAKRILGIEKLDNIATDALINFNECNDKCDTMVKTVEELKEQIAQLKLEVSILRDGGVAVSPAQIVDEWLNGKEEVHG